jgi:hypothetical protein
MQLRQVATFDIMWDYNSDVGSAKPTDQALVAVLNPAKAEAITTTEGTERMTEHNPFLFSPTGRATA